MENKDKEAILNSMPIWTFKDFEEEKFYRRKNVLEAMESYSASQNEELRKENEELKDIIEGAKSELKKWYDEANKLQSTIDEKNKEIERLKYLLKNKNPIPF